MYMQVHTHVCMYACMLCTVISYLHVCMYVCIHFLPTPAALSSEDSIHVHAGTHTCMYACMYVMHSHFLPTCVYVCIHFLPTPAALSREGSVVIKGCTTCCGRWKTCPKQYLYTCRSISRACVYVHKCLCVCIYICMYIHSYSVVIKGCTTCCGRWKTGKKQYLHTC